MNNKSLHIVYMGPFRFPAGDAAAARVLNNARCLRMSGHVVEFLSFGGSYRSEDRVGELYKFDEFQYRITNDIDRSNENAIRRITNFLVQGSNAFALLKQIKPDVVVVYNPALVLTLRLLHYTRKRAIRLVADVSECYHSSEFPGGKWMPFSWMNELNIRIVQHWISHKIVISSFLSRMYASSTNLVVPPLVDLQDSKWKSVTHLIPPFNGITCIYAGTPSRKDNVLFLLEALRISTQFTDRIRIVFLGEGLDELKKQMQTDKMAVCRDRVLFPGRVSQNEVPACYRATDFSLLFRDHNRKNNAGFPTKFVESMSSSVPVICNLTSDLGSYIEHGSNGYVLHSPVADELAALFGKLAMLNSDALAQMKMAAFSSALQHFDYRVHQQRMNHFFNF